ncbi:MAG: YfiR family protein [Deltaproteobacteria bacterium]|nr:YfiR family protein [Deltaproteobacteria bacterium]
MTWRRHRLLLHGMTLALFLLPGILFPPALAGSIPDEAKVKAAYLVNFIKFVEWPGSMFGSPGDSYQIAVLGDDSIEAALKGINEMSVSGRRVVVRKISDLSSLERYHVLFVCESEKGKVDRVIGAVKKLHVLTVSDIDDFARRGGTIGFFREKNRIVFEINEESAQEAGLKLNAKLLYLGKIVHNR